MRLLFSLIVLAGLSSVSIAQQSQGTGLIFMDRDQYLSIPPAGLPLRGEAPNYIDLSKDFPAPGKQGSQQSCVAWAVAYGLKSYQKNREHRVQGFKSDFRFSPAFIYNQIKRQSCDGGSLIADALNVVETQGALPIDAFGYDEKSCDKLPTEAQAQAALQYRIARWMRVNVQSDTEIKAQLTRGYPVIIGMKVYDSFDKHDGKEVYKINPADAGELRGGHAMVIVGYADQISAYKVLNSWGSDWGAGGYAWIDYATLRSMTMEGYVAIDIFQDHIATATVPTGLPRVAAAAEKRTPAKSAPAAPPTDEAEPSRPLGVARQPEMQETPSTTVQPPTAAPMATAPLPQPTQAPKVLTTEILEQAVRSTTEPKILFKTKENYNVRPYSAWLELPDELASTIKRVEYSFIAPGFVNPKKSLPNSNIFIAKWKGFGCVTEAHVVAYLKDGRKVHGTFNLCDVQAKT